MKLSVYKWSQYYLMYSPTWKHMINQSKINHYDNNIIVNQQSNNNNSLITTISSNHRLSIAYNILINQSKQQTITIVDKHSSQQKYYWNEYKNIIERKLKVILTMANNNNITQQKQLYQQIQQLFNNNDTTHNNSDDTYQQQPTTQQPSNLSPNTIQKHYQINQLSKRIVINQITSLLSTTSNPICRQSLSIVEIIVKILSYLFGNRLLGLEQQELNDWLTVLLYEQGDMFRIVKQRINNIIIAVIVSDSSNIKKLSSHSFTEISSSIKLFRDYNSMISTIQRFLTRIKKSQTQNGIQSTLCKQLQNVVHLLLNEEQEEIQSRLIINNCRQEIRKLDIIRELGDKYVMIIRGQGNNRKDYLQNILKELSSKQYNSYNNNNNIDMTNRNSNKKFKENSLKQQHRRSVFKPTLHIRYQLWKLTHLIDRVNRLKVIKNKYSIGMIEIDQMLFTYLQQQIIITLETLTDRINIYLGKNITNNNNKIYNNSHSNRRQSRELSNNEFVCDLNDLVYFGTLVREQLGKVEIGESQSDKWSAKLTKMLYKLDEECKRKLLCVDVDVYVQMTSLCNNNHSEQIDSPSFTTISTLYILLNNYTNHSHPSNHNNYQILTYLLQTQLLNKLLTHLEKHLIINKQHILLGKQQKIQLKSILNRLKSQSDNNHIAISKQAMAVLEEIQHKVSWVG